MRIPPENLQKIRAFHSLGEKLGTSGQPTESQFELIRATGFEAVINLALATSDNALPNEGSLVAGLDMPYVHIPVDFKEPTAQDFHVFCRVMEAFAERPVFVHCAANMRVSAFVFLYRVLRQGVPIAEAEKDLRSIWQPDAIWSQFIKDRLADRP